MAKIGDITDWLVRVRGDEAQVRSIVKLCRADKLFSASGRGRGSPDMTVADFATAMACALTTAMTTHVPSEVRKLLALRIFTVDIDIDDGSRRFNQFTVWNGANELPETDYQGNHTLPPELHEVPATLGDALAMWSDHFMQNPADGVMDWDEVSLRTAENSTVELSLYNPAWRVSDSFRQEGDYNAYAWKLRFESEEVNHDPNRRETVTKISAHALLDLAELAGGR